MKKITLNEIFDTKSGILTTTPDINLKRGDIIEDQNSIRYKVEGASFPSRPSKLDELCLKLTRLE